MHIALKHVWVHSSSSIICLSVVLQIFNNSSPPVKQRGSVHTCKTLDSCRSALVVGTKPFSSFQSVFTSAPSLLDQWDVKICICSLMLLFRLGGNLISSFDIVAFTAKAFHRLMTPEAADLSLERLSDGGRPNHDISPHIEDGYC